MVILVIVLLKIIKMDLKNFINYVKNNMVIKLKKLVVNYVKWCFLLNLKVLKNKIDL